MFPMVKCVIILIISQRKIGPTTLKDSILSLISFAPESNCSCYQLGCAASKYVEEKFRFHFSPCPRCAEPVTHNFALVYQNPTRIYSYCLHIVFLLYSSSAPSSAFNIKCGWPLYDRQILNIHCLMK